MARREAQFKSEGEVRSALQKALKGTLTDDEWDLAEDGNFVNDVLYYGGPLSDLVAWVRKLRNAELGGVRRKQRGVQPPKVVEEDTLQPVVTQQEQHDRSEELEEIIAGYTDLNDLRVRAFREEILEGRLLTAGEAEDWLKEQAKRDGPPKRGLSGWAIGNLILDFVERRRNRKDRGSSGPAPRHFDDTFHLYEHRRRTGKERVETERDRLGVAKLDRLTEFLRTPVNVGSLKELPTERKEPEYDWDPTEGAWVCSANCQDDDRYEHEYLICGRNPDEATRTPVARGRVLDWLRVLSEDLALKNKWSELQAAYYVITGHIPNLDLQTTIHVKRSPIRALTRVIMDIDPTTSPQEVAELYRSKRPGRRKPISGKQRQLAVFSMRRPETEKWEQTMNAWNKQCPDSMAKCKYDGDKWRKFRSDCKRAQEWFLSGHKIP